MDFYIQIKKSYIPYWVYNPYREAKTINPFIQHSIYELLIIIHSYTDPWDHGMNTQPYKKNVSTP